jgi:hypothetical protein
MPAAATTTNENVAVRAMDDQQSKSESAGPERYEFRCGRLGSFTSPVYEAVERVIRRSG